MEFRVDDPSHPNRAPRGSVCLTKVLIKLRVKSEKSLDRNTGLEVGFQFSRNCVNHRYKALKAFHNHNAALPSQNFSIFLLCPPKAFLSELQCPMLSNVQ